MQAFADGKVELGIISAAQNIEEMVFNDASIKDKAKKLAN